MTPLGSTFLFAILLLFLVNNGSPSYQTSEVIPSILIVVIFYSSPSLIIVPWKPALTFVHLLFFSVVIFPIEHTCHEPALASSQALPTVFQEFSKHLTVSAFIRYAKAKSFLCERLL